MRIAGLDISKNRMGIAFSDDEGRFVAHSFSFQTKNLQQLSNLYKEFQPSLSVVGLPGWGKNRDFILLFCHTNRNLLKPFIFIDESYSTILTEYFNKNMDKDECSARIFVYFALKNPKTIEGYKIQQLPK